MKYEISPFINTDFTQWLSLVRTIYIFAIIVIFIFHKVVLHWFRDGLWIQNGNTQPWRTSAWNNRCESKKLSKYTWIFSILANVSKCVKILILQTDMKIWPGIVFDICRVKSVHLLSAIDILAHYDVLRPLERLRWNHMFPYFVSKSG